MLCKFSWLNMYNYIWITHLHTTELEMIAMLLELYYMINIIHATPRYHLMPTSLTTKSYTSLLSVKTENLLLLFTALNQLLYSLIY
jgi:hypothetical protein